MTKRDRIVLLLEQYVAVQPGLVDTYGGEGGALHTAGCWKHHSYVELERVVGVLREADRELYWHLAETYFRATEKRVAYCPRCRGTDHATMIGRPCAHGQKGRRHVASDNRIPKVVRVVSSRVQARLVGRAVDWLEYLWQGDPVIPQDLTATT